MSPVDADILRRKLAIIQRAVVALEPIGADTLAAYRADLIRRKAAERLLQESVESAVDIGVHILAREGRAVPAHAFSTFAALADAGILDAELAGQLAPATGLRNRLVHAYDEIDDAIVHGAIATACAILQRFVAAIVAHLDG